jgi:ATP/maltotriose-dependent transcriptional regulator MalT
MDESHKSPTSTSSLKSVIRNDGIDIQTNHLKRPALVQKLIELLSNHPIVLLSSPAASGKVHFTSSTKQLLGMRKFLIFHVFKRNHFLNY